MRSAWRGTLPSGQGSRARVHPNARARGIPPHTPLCSPFSHTPRLACLSIIVATFCLWLMWLCTWLHQWHPLISPTLPSAGRSPAPAEGGSAGGGHR